MTPPTAPSALETSAAPLAVVERGGVVESVHLGHLVVTGPGGEVVAAVGDPHAGVYARSALKPLQLVGLLGAGLWPDGAADTRALALGCASHNGEPVHLDGVRAVLAAAGLGEEHLRGTPDLPLHAPSAARWQAQGLAPSALAQNCSGKHAAMLAACAARGWPLEGYLDPGHPVQQAALGAVAAMAGPLLAGPGSPGGPPVTTDGCGTPLPLLPLVGLARAYAQLAAPGDGPAARVGSAMRAHPYLVAGEGRQATSFMAGVPGLVAKDGAEGVFALALPDGSAAALKVLDGSTRPFPVLVAAVLAALGVDAEVVAERARVPVLGHGRPVGALAPALDLGQLGRPGRLGAAG